RTINVYRRVEDLGEPLMHIDVLKIFEELLMHIDVLKIFGEPLMHIE
ncbi:1605_t:CDS:1, partial [Racocetra persica]